MNEALESYKCWYTGIYTTIKKTRIFFKKKLTRHVSQRSVFNPELSAFLKIPQNRNTSLTTRKDWTNFCLFIAHYLSSEGGHFDTNFDRKIARLRWIKFDDRVHLRGLWKYPPIQIGAANEQYWLNSETNNVRLPYSNIMLFIWARIL